MSLNEAELRDGADEGRSAERVRSNGVSAHRGAPGSDVDMSPTQFSSHAGGDPQVEFRAASKTFDGRTHAVANLNLAIAKGEFVTLLGPSGSGKTTSLMMLAGFEEPTSGDILIAGRSLKQIPPHRRNIGMVFQSYALFPHMTVAENIAFPLTVRGVPREDAARKVEQALSIIRLTGYGGRRPMQLSGGQQQRVALARALVFEPDLVLMDEPLGALDKQLREELQIEIKHLHAELGVTVVYVTHDQSEALTLSNRIAVFDKGIVQQVDAPADLYERPRTAFVARFIGESNCIEGTVQAIQQDYCVVATSAGPIRALAIGLDRIGQRTTVCVRPERITLCTGSADAFENRIKATVQETIYHGDHVRVRMRVAQETEFTLKAIPGLVLERGSEQELGWQAIHGRALEPMIDDGPAHRT